MAQYTLNFIEQDFTILFLLLFKRGVVLAVFVVEFPGFLVQMVAWGLKKVPKKFEDFPLCHNHNRMIKNCFCKHLFVNF